MNLIKTVLRSKSFELAQPLEVSTSEEEVTQETEVEKDEDGFAEPLYPVQLQGFGVEAVHHVEEVPV